MSLAPSCLSWESARYPTLSCTTSASDANTSNDTTYGVFPSKQQCPLRTGVRCWSTWSGKASEPTSSPDSMVTDNSSEVDFTSNPSPAASASACVALEAAQDSLKALPSRPKVPPGSQKDSQRHCTVEENRPVHVNRLQNRILGSGPADHHSATIEIQAVRSRCRPRRRPCSEATQVAPPKLRRDTDCTDSIVRLIVFFSTKLVHAIWSQAAVTPKMTKDFNGAGVLPLQVFIQETLRRSKTSYSTLQVALFYLILLRPHVKPMQGTQQSPSGCRALQCGRRMFLTALILASKYLQDRNYSARAWSKISGLPVSEINENERQYLDLIKYNLHMTKETFENWSRVVLTVCRASGQGPLGGNKPDSPPSSPDSMSYKADFERPGSPAWWSHHLLRITPDVVRDTKLTEEYLGALAGAATFLDSGISLDTPPSSPESLADALSDHSSPLVLSASSSASAYNFAQGSEFGQSPAFVGSMPNRPLPPNLPTPQTTPRYDSVSMFSRRSSRSDLRCLASAQALVGIEKQALNAANLETCPPPRPREWAHVSSAPVDIPRAASDLAMASCVSSPESIVSDISVFTARSRSSSMSSNSSVWSLPAMGPKVNETSHVSLPRVINLNQMQSKPVGCAANIGAYSFYHPVRPSISASSEAKSDKVVSACKPQQAHPNFGATEIYGGRVGNPQATQLPVNQSSQSNNSVKQCTSPAVTKKPTDTRPSQFSTGPSKTHKRNRSSNGEAALQNEIRHFIWSQQFPVYVEDDKKPTTHVEASDKQAQYPSQHWANPRKPVPNVLQNKRIALHHSSSSEQRHASELAAEYLRRDVTVI